MAVEVPMVVAHHIAAVVHPFRVAAGHSAVEDLAADGNKKVYTLYRFFFDDTIISKGVGISCLNRTGCR